jgi:5,10-methenyltetrahydrofolate synthetase
MEEQKEEIRQQTRAALDALTTKQKRYQSNQLNAVRLHSKVQESTVIGLYQAGEYHPDLRHADFWLREKGKTVLHPKINLTTHTITFHTNILQPPHPDDPEVIIVPGDAFDDAGNRLGRGWGLYDKYLEQFPGNSRPYCIGVAFAEQHVDSVPTEEHDIAVDEVIFASNVYVNLV